MRNSIETTFPANAESLIPEGNCTVRIVRSAAERTQAIAGQMS
jgi:hypothetical protein